MISYFVFNIKLSPNGFFLTFPFHCPPFTTDPPSLLPCPSSPHSPLSILPYSTPIPLPTPRSLHANLPRSLPLLHPPTFNPTVPPHSHVLSSLSSSSLPCTLPHPNRSHSSPNSPLFCHVTYSGPSLIFILHHHYLFNHFHVNSHGPAMSFLAL